MPLGEALQKQVQAAEEEVNGSLVLSASERGQGVWGTQDSLGARQDTAQSRRQCSGCLMQDMQGSTRASQSGKENDAPEEDYTVVRAGALGTHLSKQLSEI